MKFEPVIQPVTYGNGRKAFRWRVLFRDDSGKPVGITPKCRGGQAVECPTRREAVGAARAEIERLKGRRLVAFAVTKKDIDNGMGHSAEACPVAQSLWRAQEGLGFDRWRYNFRVDTYGAYTDPDGVGFEDRDTNTEHYVDPPPVVAVMKREPGWREDSMEDWTMNYDDWYDAQGTSVADWREEQGYDRTDTSYGKPSRPTPVSFVLDLDELVASGVKS